MELVHMFGALCTASSFCFQLVGMQICYSIVKKGGTGDMSPFTFISYFVACSMWLKYGLIQKLPVVIAVNAYGATLNFIYTIIFYRFSTKKLQFHRFIFLGAAMLVSPLMYIRYYQTDVKLAMEHLGSYCVLLTVIGYGAPLVSLTDVWRTKSTESLSFVLIFANFMVAVLWTVYGGMIKDKYVQAPNVLGGILALIQLSLFIIYPSSQLKNLHAKTD
ncbi:sugar transporter SWEET1-like [Mercenaria mercenaria]|uniref:sugar transporter SWEET1-like n=1 Tax=Mercenaria mercenaria TaxID=6596 RepID=UPI00234F32DD|nr:sugar transporter SWEET1-like [Mercenaria mercenaria]XP_045169687.2 sugar transporter SWEET1-like [Mercenaria mercenaria]